MNATQVVINYLASLGHQSYNLVSPSMSLRQNSFRFAFACLLLQINSSDMHPSMDSEILRR